ncbi:hypothetical protein CAPTEDRAFT_133955 [Capitella teleta]|uniref:Uncharacterized protein n=1 Tax=Capitella teleta TaxID=283909 RepID=R7URB1_CAPTE|nr:hypothetical protein CAPTEDRAFT_133955 [Capitella teleta]|eukprot:ELU06467.1 hypothetical protein CAPTEDRAFT_133955 [Capitella teleta]
MATEEGSLNVGVATGRIERNADTITPMYELGSHVSTSDTNGVTSLHIASATRDSCVVKSMLENAADPNTRDAKGNTPLYYVMMSDNKQRNDVVDVLLEYGAKAELENEDGDSPLKIAISMDNSYAVKRFLEQKYGMEINIADARGVLALHFACAQGNRGMARFPLENDSDVNRRDQSGKSPLHFASST